MIKTLIDIIPHQIKNFPKEDAICSKENDIWKKYNSQQVQEMIDKVSLGLLKFGIKPKDHIAIISNNRPEWNFVDLGILQIGAVDVPLYPTISEIEYEFIFNEAEIKMIFISGQDIYDKIKNVIPRSQFIKKVYSFDKLENISHWSELISGDLSQFNDSLKKLKEEAKETDLATIIYTSGTTGG